MADENENQDDGKLAEAMKRLEALEAKKDEILGELKTERQKRKEAEQAKTDAEEAARAKEEEAAAQSGDIEAIKKQLEDKHAKALEAERKRADDASSQLNRLVIDGGIKEALSKAEVAPQLSKGAALAFKDGRNIEIKDGAAFVDGVPLADAVNEWAGSEEGSVYKAAGQASGSGAPGGSNSVSKPLAELGDAERLKLAREGKLRSAQGA